MLRSARVCRPKWLPFKTAMPRREFLTHSRHLALRPRGFILLAVLVFLLLASLLSLGDLRTVLTQQRMVTTQLSAGNAFAYTESALNVVESFAVEELMSIADGNAYKGGSNTALNNSCAATTSSDPLACTLAPCSTYNPITDILNNVNGQTPLCSFCRRPSPGCKNRLDEPKTGLPWTELPIVFRYVDSSNTLINRNYLGKFLTYMEYLGMAPCDYSVNNANVTSLGSYGSAICPGGVVTGPTSTGDGTPRCSTSVPSTYTCPVMRVTVSSEPDNLMNFGITLQSTVIQGKRVSFRQVLP